MRLPALALILSLTVSLIAHGSPTSIKLRATPQKFRTFYSSDDPKIPPTIRNQLANQTRSTQRLGVRWTIESNALIRASAPRSRLSFADGLPVGGLRTIAITTDGAVWAGGDEGLVRYQNRSNDRWQYFAGRRYLPS